MERFDFSYAEYEQFMERCPFTEEERNVLELRRRGLSVVQISLKLNMGTRTVDRRIRSIKRKIAKEIQMA